MYTVLDKIYAGQDSSGGMSKTMYRVTLQVDTAADMPDPEEHWAAGSTCEVLEDGGSKYRLSNARTWEQVNFKTGGGGVTEEYVAQKIAEAQLSGGEVDLSAYPTESKVETMIDDAVIEIDNEIAAIRQEVADSQVNTDNDIAALQNDTTTLRMDCDNVMHNMEQMMQEQTQLADDVEAIKIKTTATAFPRQDASIEGIWMKYAEYLFPGNIQYESADLVLLVRNRILGGTGELGILSARLRYNNSNREFQVAGLEWLPAMRGIDMNKFCMCYNAAEARVELYVRCDNAYNGYVFTALAMSTQSVPLDMTAWVLEDATEGVSELPTVDDGWTTIPSQG